jgi:RNA polymerase sigma-70 factor (ECF subfamily)
MLRITRLDRPDVGPIIKLEGKLLEPWVDEVLLACDMPDIQTQRPQLDLSAVSYVDGAGVALLRDLLKQQFTIIACSGFVAELLDGTQAKSDSVPANRGSDETFSEHDALTDFDVALLDALLAGEPQAYEVLVRRHGPQMLAVARQILDCEQDSADAVQDAFISAFQAIGQFAGRSSLRTWLHRIVVNACLMKLRSRARHPVVSIESLCPQFDDTGHQLEPASPWVEQPTDLLMDAEIRNRVRVSIDSLPDAYRTVLLLRDIEEFDTAQTAQVLGVSIAVVKTRLHRARQALRTLLEPIFSV